MPIHLGAYHYNHPVIVLAPMAGISDLPFRRLCQENGADYSVAEMVSAKPDLLHTAYAENRLRFDTDSRYPKIIQLVGGDPALMAEAAMLMQARGADVIDINMGCPAKSVAKQLAGSALLADLKQVEKILNKVVHAVNIPVTLKTRLGYHDAQPNLSEVAMIAEDNGISALAVHGRSRNQRFNGRASFELMANVKAQRRLPIIANGDITHATQAKALIDRYGFDGIMIGRAAQGNPWIFARCQALINTKNLPLPTINTAAQQIYTHIQALHQHYGKQAVCIARKHLHAYLRQHPDYADLRSQINHAADANSQLTLIEKHFTIHTHTNAFQDTSWDANLLSIRQPKDSHAPHYHSRRY